jgi:hypothetical protein
MGDRSGVLAVRMAMRRRFPLPANDVAWSAWREQRAALADMERYRADLQQGAVPPLAGVCAPTRPLQDVRLRSGWGAECMA